MSKEIKDVNLSFCCKKDWNQFASVDERTRFCSSCQFNVIDFTKANNVDLENALKKGERVCGRFKVSQMSEAFLKSAAASLLIVAGASAMQCKEELEPRVKPIPEVAIPNPEEELLSGEFMGIVLKIDSTDTVHIMPRREEK